ncbi:MAG: hypothetical protein KDB00_22815 [Planctomycetales bacterium]|nr:hypothetical protein [Planctomycetales bacterium]
MTPYANSTRRKRHRPIAPAPRRGTLMTCVLVCMLVVASIVAVIAKDAIAGRRETKLRLQMHQTERLLDAGILRAAIQTKRDPDYVGETWKPNLQMAGRDANASVVITVSEDATTVTARIGFEPNITTQSYVYSSSEIQ